MSIIFKRDEHRHTHSLLETESCIVCGNEVFRPQRTERENSDGCFRLYNDADDIFDISMSEAISFLAFPFLSSIAVNNTLWLKRAVHAGYLHCAVHNTKGGYYFSLNELEKFRDNILAFGGIDPLDKNGIRQYAQNTLLNLVLKDVLESNAKIFKPAFEDDYSKRFFDIMAGIGGLELNDESE
jgi:hypothetical protein